MQKQWWLIGLLAGCSGSTHPVAPPPSEPAVVAPPVATPDAQVVAVVPDAAPPAPPGACVADLAPMIPSDAALKGALFYRDGGKTVSGKYSACDTLDRLVLWANDKATPTRDPKRTKLTGSVVVIARNAVDHPVRGAYDKGAHCFDDCEGPDGGHAGCSMVSGCVISSKVLGGEDLMLFAEQGYALEKGETRHGCGPQARALEYGGAIGYCSTAAHLAVLTGESCGNDGSVLALAIYDNVHDRADETYEPLSAHGDLDRARTSGTRWTYAFPAFAGKPGASLSIDVGANPSATLEVDGVSEECFAFALRPLE